MEIMDLLSPDNVIANLRATSKKQALHELARRAAERIVVDYELLPAVVDMQQALEIDAPQVHPFGNVLHEVRVEHGDPDAQAEVWVEGYYETGMQDQAPLGPEAGMAVPAEDGGIDLFVATQWLHIDRKQLALLALERDGLFTELVRTAQAALGSQAA